MNLKNIIIFIISCLFIWSIIIEPDLITVKKVNLKSNSIKNLRIVFVSDFHFSKFAFFRINKIVNKINKLKPDVVIIGGDYLIMHDSKYSMDMKKVVSKLSEIESKYGIYSVLGNHDYYKDWKYVKNSFLNSKIKILENSNIKLEINGQELYIAGISDMQTTRYDLNKALNNTKPPVILVSHSPDIMEIAKDKVDFILSGHTHGGQVRIPFYGAVIVPSQYGKKYEYGLIQNKLYVTSGLGTSILHMRFNCFPEIAVIDF